MLLIDEVDRADEALEAVLLELLSEFQISIPEIGTVRAKHLPYVVLTSNNTRDLSAALKRRCLHLFLDYPDAERELAIIRSKDTGLAEALAVRLVEIVRGLRELELRKSPSISETIDWARTLAVLGVKELTADVLSQTLNVVVKYERDLEKAMRALPPLVDPNADGAGQPGSRPRARPRARPPTADHDHDDDGPDGKAVRAAKDRPGRHDAAYGGTGGRSTNGTEVEKAARTVPSGQGPGRSPPGRPASARSESAWRTRSTGSSGCCGCTACASAPPRRSTPCTRSPSRACSSDREVLRSALAVSLVKDRRDMEAFDRVFDRFFGLRAVVEDEGGHGHGHAHDDLTDEGELEQFTLSEDPGDTPEQGHSHGKPDDIKEYFKPEDMAQQYNLHQEANKIDIAALTDEIVLSNDTTDERRRGGPGPALDQPDAQPRRPRRPGQQRPACSSTPSSRSPRRWRCSAWLDEAMPRGGRPRRPGARRQPGRAARAAGARCWPGCPSGSSSTSSG